MASPRICLAAEAPEIERHLNLVYAVYGERQMHVDMFVPTGGKEARPAVLVIHGGSWLKGDRTKFHSLAEKLAQRGFVAAAVEYRLGGEAKFPAAIVDCNTATRWLRANAAKYGVDPDQITAVGGSAGGHLVGLMASATEIQPLQGKGHNEHSSRLQAAVVMAGPMELATGPVAQKSRENPKQSNSNRWLGKTIDQDRALYELASPISHLDRKTSPLLFMTGEMDHPERNRATRNKLRELGVATDIRVYAEGKHGCWNREPWQTIMVNDMVEFLYQQLKRKEPAHTLLQHELEHGTMRLDPQGVTLTTMEPAMLPRLNNPIRTARLVSGEEPAEVKLQVGIDRWSFAVPRGLADESVTIRLDTIGRPYLSNIARIMRQQPDGTLTLPAHEAVTHGEKLRYEPQPHKNTVGYWSNVDDWCSWKFYLEQPGTFQVAILQGCGKGHGGSEVAVLSGKQKLTFKVQDTGHFQNFQQRELGTLSFEQPGVYALELRALTKAAGAVMDVRQVKLIRQK